MFTSKKLMSQINEKSSAAEKSMQSETEKINADLPQVPRMGMQQMKAQSQLPQKIRTKMDGAEGQFGAHKQIQRAETSENLGKDYLNKGGQLLNGQLTVETNRTNKNSTLRSAGEDGVNSASILNTFAQIMESRVAEDSTHLDKVKLIRQNFYKAMLRNDQDVQDAINPRHRRSDQAINNNILGEQEGVKSARQESMISDIYKEVQVQLEILLRRVNQKGYTMITSNAPQNRQTQNSQLLNSTLMSLEQIMRVGTQERVVPSTQDQLIQFFDVQSRIYLLKLHQNQLLSEGSQQQIEIGRISSHGGIWKMSAAQRKKMKAIFRIFQNRNNEIPRMKTHDIEDLNRPGGPNQQRTDFESPRQFSSPIYFDELCLSRFLEDYLDYQIEYAYGELSKMQGETPSPSQFNYNSNKQSKNVAQSLDVSNESIAMKKKKLADKFLMKVSGEGAAQSNERNVVNNSGGGGANSAPQDKEPALQGKKKAQLDSSAKKKTSMSPIINELIHLLEIDRLIFKSFNTLLAMLIKSETKKIADFLQEQNLDHDVLDRHMPTSQQWKEDSQILELFTLYVKESLKFIIFSFLKRCRIIIKILVKYKESVRDEKSAVIKAGGDGGLEETRESIIANMLAQNLKWAFLTISTCIEKSEAYQQEKHEQTANVNNDETNDNALMSPMPIMADLLCFKNILQDLQESLNMFSDQDGKKNQQYYKNTLEKLINRLFIAEEEEGQEGDDDNLAKNQHHNLMTHKNQLLDKVKKELLHRGQYQEVDQKCHSFRSFINLMETNQLFKELRTDPRMVSGDLGRDMHIAKQSFAQSKLQVSGSMYMSSMASQVQAEQNERKSQAVYNIGDEFINQLAKEMGMPTSQFGHSVNASTSLAGGSMYTKNRSRMGTYIAQSPGELQKNRSEHLKSDRAMTLQKTFEEQEEGNFMSNRKGVSPAQEVKKSSTGYGSQGGNQFDEQMLKLVNKKPKERSVTFNLPSNNPTNQRHYDVDTDEKSNLGVILTEDDREDENHMSKSKSPRERAATFDRQQKTAAPAVAK